MMKMLGAAVAAGTLAFVGSASDATAHLFVTLRPEAGQATPYEISISPAPEPATWAILSTGFGLAGSALRRSRRRAAPA